jgi:hypothetical protein
MAIHQKYRAITKNAVRAAMVEGPLPLLLPPGADQTFDFVAIGAIWTTMFIAMANKSGRDFDSEFVKQFVSALVVGVVAYFAACKGAGWICSLASGGLLIPVAMGASTLMGVVFTYKVAAAISDQLESGDFGAHGPEVAAATIISLVCSLPKVSEIKDMFQLRGEA